MTKPEKQPYIGYRSLPPFTFYAQFADDWDGFSGTVRKVVGEFLELLQEKYDDSEVGGRWEQKGKYWAARLPEIEYRVLWTVVYPSRPGTSIISQSAEEIHILAVEPIPWGLTRGA